MKQLDWWDIYERSVAAVLTVACLVLVGLLLARSVEAAVIAPVNTTAGSSHQDVGTNAKQQQAFAGKDFDADYLLTGISIYMYAVGAPSDSVVVELYDSNLGVSAPYSTGSVLASATNAAATFGGSYALETFTFGTPLAVSELDDLAVRVKRSGSPDNTNYYRVHGAASDSDGPADTRESAYYNGSAWTNSSDFARYVFEGTEVVDPACYLSSASAAFGETAQPGIHAVGFCQGFYPTAAWLGAVRLEPIGVHQTYSEGLGPYPDPYTLDNADLPFVSLPDGRYRVRMYGRDGATLYISDNYADIEIEANPYGPLTVGNDPYDWDFGDDDTLLDPATVGGGYTFSASVAEIVAAGGLRITAEGCADIVEDGTSTRCVLSDAKGFLERNFPLLTWPLGIYNAFFDAYEVIDATATPATRIAIDGQGDWIPDLVLVDSASSGAGIGRWIPASAFAFYYSVAQFGVWLLFIRTLYRKSQSLL